MESLFRDPYRRILDLLRSQEEIDCERSQTSIYKIAMRFSYMRKISLWIVVITLVFALFTMPCMAYPTVSPFGEVTTGGYAPSSPFDGFSFDSHTPSNPFDDIPFGGYAPSSPFDGFSSGGYTPSNPFI